MKIVYLWRNGQAILVHTNQDGEYDYPNEKWTEQQPPTGIYFPIYFDGQQWIGQTREEFEKSLPEEKPTTDEKDLIIANLSQTVLEQQTQIDNVQKDVANLITVLVQNGGNVNV